jgi:hypothetical protein
MIKTIVSLVFILISGFAHAGTYFDSKESCMSAGYAGKAVGYKPSAKHKAYGEDRIAKHELRRLETDACVLIGAVPGKRWVFLKEGTNVLTKGTEVKMLNECQNDIFEVHYLKKDEPTALVAQTQSVGCTTDDCGNSVTTVTNKTIIQKIVEITDICRVNGVEIPMTNGKCVAPSVTAVAPVKVESPVTSKCLNCTGSTKSALTNLVAQSGCPDCNPELKLTGKVARTDGRCVVQVNFNGSSRYIRLSPEKGTGRLMAAIVDNEQAEFNRSNPIVYVGADDAFFHANPTCEASVKGFSSDRSYAPTTRKLGLPGCTFVGKV